MRQILITLLFGELQPDIRAEPCSNMAIHRHREAHSVRDLPSWGSEEEQEEEGRHLARACNKRTNDSLSRQGASCSLETLLALGKA